KTSEIELFSSIQKWVMDKFKPANPNKSDVEIFGKNSKYAFKEFFNPLHSIKLETIEKIKNSAYTEAVKFIEAFNSKDTINYLK
ncbi:MAG: class II fructose-bisphosphate aldolase, partial [Candidatus Helarchaeota archaeon]